MKDLIPDKNKIKISLYNILWIYLCRWWQINYDSLFFKKKNYDSLLWLFSHTSF